MPLDPENGCRSLGAWFRVVKLARLRCEELRGLARIAIETRDVVKSPILEGLD
jgi:hypothetical protein